MFEAWDQVFLGVGIEVVDWCVINLNVVGHDRGVDFLELCKGIGATWVVAEGFHEEVYYISLLSEWMRKLCNDVISAKSFLISRVVLKSAIGRYKQFHSQVIHRLLRVHSSRNKADCRVGSYIICLITCR